MRAQRNIRLLNAYTLFANMMFVIAVIVPYYRDEMGLSFQDFLIGEAAFAAIVVLLEVPTGWISDIWQRRHVLVLGSLFSMVGYACLLYGDSLFWAVLAQSLFGVGVSLVSGTNSAMLYDTLLSAGRENEFRAHEGKRMGLAFYSVAGASIASGPIYALNHKLPLLLNLLMVLASMFLACRMDEPERHKKRPEKHPLADMVETARYALRGHAEVGMIILFSAMLFSSTKLIMWSQQPYYMALKLPEEIFGVLVATGFLLAGASSHLSHRFDGRFGNTAALIAVWVVSVAVCLGASLAKSWAGVALLMIGGSCIYGLASPHVNEAINRRVGSERRATILSTQNLMVSLLFIPVSTVAGWISDSHGIAGALLAIAAWLGVAGLWLGLMAARRRVTPPLPRP